MQGTACARSGSLIHPQMCQESLICRLNHAAPRLDHTDEDTHGRSLRVNRADQVADVPTLSRSALDRNQNTVTAALSFDGDHSVDAAVSNLLLVGLAVEHHHAPTCKLERGSLQQGGSSHAGSCPPAGNRPLGDGKTRSSGDLLATCSSSPSISSLGTGSHQVWCDFRRAEYDPAVDLRDGLADLEPAAAQVDAVLPQGRDLTPTEPAVAEGEHFRTHREPRPCARSRDSQVIQLNGGPSAVGSDLCAFVSMSGRRAQGFVAIQRREDIEHAAYVA
jgi:hypothetical protein